MRLNKSRMKINKKILIGIGVLIFIFTMSFNVSADCNNTCEIKLNPTSELPPSLEFPKNVTPPKPPPDGIIIESQHARLSSFALLVIITAVVVLIIAVSYKLSLFKKFSSIFVSVIKKRITLLIYAFAVSAPFLLVEFGLTIFGDGIIEGKLAWATPVIITHIGALFLFFIIRDIVIKKEVFKQFKGGFIVLLSLTALMFIFETLAKIPALKEVSIGGYTLSLIFSWNTIFSATIFGLILTPFFSIFFFIFILSFYEFIFRLFTGKLIAHPFIKIGAFALLTLLSIGSLIYYVVPDEKPLDFKPFHNNYDIKTDANPWFDHYPTLEILRLNKIKNARWDDSFEHGPIHVRAGEEIKNINYRWVEDIRKGSYSIERENKPMIFEIPMRLFVMLFFSLPVLAVFIMLYLIFKREKY